MRSALVGHHAQRARLRARPRGLRRHRVAVAVADAAARRRVPDVHQLVAGDQHGHGGAASDLHPRPSDGGQYGDRGGIDDAAGREHDVAGGHLAALARDVGAGGDRLQDLDPRPAVDRARLLHRLHRGRARGHRRPGHHLHRLPGRQRRVRVLAGAQLSGHPQDDGRPRDVGRAHRVAVHRRAVEGRHVGIGAHVLGEHAAEGVGEQDLLRGQPRGVVEDDPERVVYGDGRHVSIVRPAGRRRVIARTVTDTRTRTWTAHRRRSDSRFSPRGRFFAQLRPHPRRSGSRARTAFAPRERSRLRATMPT